MAWPERQGKRWFAVYREPKTGIRRSVALGEVTEDEAREQAARVTREVEGREPRPQTVAWRGLFAAFLQSRRTRRRRPATLRMYRQVLGRLVKAWAATPVRAASQAAFERYVADRDWGPRSIAMLATQTRAMIRWAKKARLACPDFLEAWEGPTVRVRRRHVLTAKQLRAVALEARESEHGYDLPVHLAIYAGLAWGDLKALRWSEVDLKGGWIQRPRQKTDEPIRVPIPTPLRRALQRHPGIAGLVCPNLPKESASSLRCLKNLYEKAGVDVEAFPAGERGWHLLRHSYATLVGRLTRDVATVGALLGHRPGSPVTLRYVHGDEERLVEAQRLVTKAIG